MLSQVEHEKSSITSGPDQTTLITAANSMNLVQIVLRDILVCGFKNIQTPKPVTFH